MKRFGIKVLYWVSKIVVAGVIVVAVFVGFRFLGTKNPPTTPVASIPTPAPAPKPIKPDGTPPARSTDEDPRGAATRVLDGIRDAFNGYCAAQGVVILLKEDEWSPINLHPAKCMVVARVLKGKVEYGDEADQPFPAVGDHSDRDARSVRAAKGTREASFKYSLCPRGTRLPVDWDCSPLPSTARR